MLGEGGANGAVKRRMKLPDGSEHDFVYKAISKEKAHHRIGIPLLAIREEASYEIDRLLGDGTVVPASVAVMSGTDGGGSYQAFVPGAISFYGDGSELQGKRLEGISTKDLIRHPHVQRMTVLDALLGHEDRHGGNVMFSWKDPKGPKTANNLQIHAVDNGYALAEGHKKAGGNTFSIRDPWSATIDWRDPDKLEDRWDIQKKILSKIPEALHKQMKQVDPADVAKAMVKSGIKDASAIRAALVRLVVLQDNPEALKPFIRRRRSDPPQWGPQADSSAVKGQEDWQNMSHRDPEKLIRDHTDLPENTLMNIRNMAKKALGR